MTAAAPRVDEAALPQHIVDFINASHAFFGRRRESRTIDGRQHTTFQPCLFDQVADDLAGSAGRSARLGARSLPPVHVSALDLLMRVEKGIGSTATYFGVDAQADRNGHRAPHIADALAKHTFAPQDSEELVCITGLLVEWTERALTLLGETPVYYLRKAPCPVCSTEKVRRQDDAGQWVPQPALRLTAVRATCQACKASWPADSFGMLGRLLGCEGIEGLDDEPVHQEQA